MTSGHPPAEKKRRRRWWIPLGIFLGLIVAILVGLWVGRVPLVEWTIARYAALQGYGPAEIHIERMDLSGIVIRDLRLGPEGAIRADEVDATYSFADLRAGMIDTLTIRRLAVAVEAGEGGFALRGIEPQAATEKAPSPEGEPAEAAPKGLALPPVRHLVLEDAAIDAETPLGPMVVAMNGEASGEAGGPLALEASFVGTAETASFEGRLRATADQSGAITGTFSLQNGVISLDRGTVSGLAGEAKFAGTADAIERLQADLRYRSLGVAGTQFEPGGLSVRMTDETLDADADLVWPGGRITLSVKGDPRVEPFEAQFGARGDVDISSVSDQIPLAKNSSGAVKFDLSGKVADIDRLADLQHLPPDQWLRVATLEGDINVALKDVALEGLATARGAGGLLRIVSTEEAALIEAPDGFAVSGLTLDAALLARLPESARVLLAEPARLQLVERDGTPATLLLATDGDGPTVQLIAGLKLDAPRLDSTGAVNAVIALDQDLAVRNMEVAELNARIGETKLAGMTVAGGLRLSGLRGTPDALSGAATLDATVRGRADESIALSNLDLTTTGAVHLDAERLTFRPESAQANLGATTIQDNIRLPGPTAFTLAKGGDPLVALDLATGAIEHRITLAPFQMEATVTDVGGAEVSAHMTVGRMAVTGGLPGEQRLAIDGAELDVPAFKIAAEGLTGELVRSEAGTALTLAASRLRHTAEPALVAPLTAGLTARLADDVLTFGVSITEESRAIDLSIHGRHELHGDTRTARLELAPLKFQPGGRQPKDLFPFADGRIKDVEGTVSASGKATWSEAEPEVELNVALDALGFSIDGNTISELSGGVTVNGIDPVTTPPRQHLTGKIAAPSLAPMPFDLTFQLRPDGRVAIERAQTVFAGGRFETRDAIFDPKVGAGTLPVQVEKVDLAKIMDLAELEDVSGSGTLSGTIPLTMKDGKVAIDGGALAADGSGVLRISGAKIEQLLGKRDDTVGLMVQALDDFHFDVLDLSLDKAYAGEGRVRIHMEGANPAVLEGYPFVFNINLTSNFDRLAQLFREGLTAADHVLQWGVEDVVR